MRAFGQVSSGGNTVSIIGTTQTGTPIYNLCAPPWKGVIGGFDVKPLGLGGWTLSAHHAYDPVAGVLYKGDGTRQDAHDFNQPRAEAVYGFGPGQVVGSLPEGQKATLQTVMDVVGHPTVASDGSLYINRVSEVWRISLDGIMHRVGGGGNLAVANGLHARDVSLGNISALAAGIHGEVYVMTGHQQILEIDANEILTIIAGTGSSGFSPDGTLATQAAFDFNSFVNEVPGLSVHPDSGLVYFSDKFNNRVRMIAADGRLVTLAGGGPSNFAVGGSGPVAQFGGDGSDARAATALLDSPGTIAFGPLPDRQLYFLDTCNRSVRTVDQGGILRTLMGGLHTCNTAQTGVSLPTALAAMSDGRLVVSRESGTYILNPEDGSSRQITGVVDNDNPQCNATDCPALHINGHLSDFAVAPDDTVWFLGGNAVLSRLYPSVPVTTATISDTVLSSTDGGEVYVLDGRGRHLRTLDALTNVVTQTFGYDSAGVLITVTDRDGNVTTIERDGSGNPVAIVGPFGSRTTLQIGGDGYLASVTGPSTENWSMQYQPGGLLSRLTDERLGLHKFTYDPNGFLITDTNPLNDSITLDRHGSLTPGQVTHSSPMGRTWNYAVTVDDGGTETIHRTAPTGLTSTTTIGNDYKTVSSTPDGMQSTMQAKGDPRFGISSSPYAGSWSEKTPLGLTLSGSGSRNVTLSDPTDPLTLSSLTESSTINGRTSSSAFIASTKTMSFMSAAGRTGSMTLDDKGRVSQVNAPGVTAVQFHYDAQGRNDTITQGSRVTAFGFDAHGFVNSVTDPAGHHTILTNDASGRPTLATQADATTIGMAYDQSSNVTSVTPPGRPEHDFSYDLNDNETLYTPPNAGGQMSTATNYNADQQVSLVSRPDGDAITPGYELSGRLQTLTTEVGTTTLSYAAGGQLSSIAAPGEGLAYGYDGALLKSVTWSGRVAGTFQRTYDTSFRVQTETVGGTTINYSYDNDDLLTQAGDLSIPRSAATGFVSTGTTLGTLQESNTYDAFGALQTYTVMNGGNVLYSVNYGTRDQLGRVIDKTETISGQTHAYHYGYDAKNRLVDVFNDGIAPDSTAWQSSATYASGALITFRMVEYKSLQNGNLNEQPDLSTTWWVSTHAYAYDPNANRLLAPGLTASPSYDAQDRLLSYGNCTYGYKLDGSLQTKSCPEGTTTYDYDAFGNLRNVKLPDGTHVEYIIDGQNRRAGKRSCSTAINVSCPVSSKVEGFLYRSQLQPVAWLNGDDTIKSIFVYGLRGNVPEYMIQNGTTYRFITDEVGSVRLVINASTGATTERIDYDEFGNVLVDSAPGMQPFGFAGGLYDHSTCAVRFGRRDYDPTLGRWMAKDPIKFEGGNANLYGYAASDPINLTDITGLAIFINKSSVPILVSGNIGSGHGSGAQMYGIIPPGEIGGGEDHEIPVFASRQDALDSYYGLVSIQPVGALTDIDFYDRAPASPRTDGLNSCSSWRPEDSAEDKVIGDEEGPRYDVTVDSNGHVTPALYWLDFPAAYWRYKHR